MANLSMEKMAGEDGKPDSMEKMAGLWKTFVKDGKLVVGEYEKPFILGKMETPILLKDGKLCLERMANLSMEKMAGLFL